MIEFKFAFDSCMTLVFILMSFLRLNNGYVEWNDLEETALQQLPGVVYVGRFDGSSSVSFAQLRTWLQDDSHIVIANVMHGRHFVLVVGWNTVDEDQLWVNDPGFNMMSYSYSRDVVGWRIFTMAPLAPKIDFFKN
jgi:hypothetical protein